MLLSGTGGSSQAVEENEPGSNLTQRGRPVFVCNFDHSEKPASSRAQRRLRIFIC